MRQVQLVAGSSPLVPAPGCELVQGPTGAIVKTDGTRISWLPGLYACGDEGRAPGTIALAVADGADAGTAVDWSQRFADV